MLISRIVLKNWRNFRAIDVALSDRVFIVGANASGKSNFLDALRFLREIAKPGGGLQSSLSQRGGLSKVRCLSARKDPDVEIEVEISEPATDIVWRYAIGLEQQVRGNRFPILKYEKVWKDGKLILDRPDSADRKDELRLTQTHLEQINSNAEFREVAKFLESIRYLHLVPQLLRSSEIYKSPAVPDDPYGRNFLELVARTPEKTRRSRLKKIEAALRQAVPQMRDLTDTKDEAGIPHLEVLYEHWRPKAGRQQEDQFSDGTLRLIGLFWALLDGDSPLLLEEPELSLNAAIVKRLPALFYQLHRKRSSQVFVTTHSWELLSDKGVGAEEVILLTPSPEGTRAQVASARKEIRALLEAGLSIGEAALPYTVPSSLEQFELFS
ncbi:MAG: AAA family ATPase [Edaphobacter sp.]